MLKLLKMMKRLQSYKHKRINSRISSNLKRSKSLPMPHWKQTSLRKKKILQGSITNKNVLSGNRKSGMQILKLLRLPESMILKLKNSKTITITSVSRRNSNWLVQTSTVTWWSTTLFKQLKQHCLAVALKLLQSRINQMM